MKYLNYEDYNNKRDISSEIAKISQLYSYAREFLQKEFTNAYEDNHKFHDMYIRSIELTSEKFKKDYYPTIIIELSKDVSKNSSFRVKYYNVGSVNFRSIGLNSIVNTVTVWIYDELYIEDNIFNHNIMFTDETEINIQCESIDLEVLNKQ